MKSECLLSPRLPVFLHCYRNVSNSPGSEPVSSLGFHEVMLGCARPLQHPAPLLFGGPLGVATSARDPGDLLLSCCDGTPEASILSSRAARQTWDTGPHRGGGRRRI